MNISEFPQFDYAKALAWCKMHDWGKDAFMSSGCIFVYDNEIDDTIRFTNFHDLKVWAGY